MTTAPNPSEQRCEGCRVPYHYWRAVRCIEMADGLIFCSLSCLERYEAETGYSGVIANELPFPWDRPATV